LNHDTMQQHSGRRVTPKLLKKLNVDLEKARIKMEDMVRKGPEIDVVKIYPLTPRAKKVVEFASEKASEMNHDQVSSEHLLLGLLKDPDGVAAQILNNFGLKLENVYEKAINIFDW